MTTSPQKNLAILVGGGPAPGINGVISAATIRAQIEGVSVLGIQEGFACLKQGNIEHVHPLTIDEVSRIHFRGGSHIGIARANPTKGTQLLVDTLVGAILKRLSYGRLDGVAIIAEGLVLELDPEELKGLAEAERDAHGHLRIADVNIGYELRCADPVPFDLEYTRDLGYCAARFILSGGSGAMVSRQGGNFVAIPFGDMIDPRTGRTKVRMVDVHSTRYAIARHYMIRLRKDDFEDPHEPVRFEAETL